MTSKNLSGTGTVGISDVARGAGVSVSTVSRVLNDAPDVSAQTRSKVQRVITELGFVPNSAARTLSLGASQTITVLTTEVALYGYGEIISGINQAAQEVGFVVDIRLLSDSEGASQDTRLRQLIAPGAGALIIVDYGPHMHEAAQEVLSKRDAVILVRSHHAAEAVRKASERSSVLWLDENLGMQLATQYLLSMGHRTVHHITVPAGLAAERSSGWRQTLEEFNRPVPESLVVSGWGAEEAFQSAGVLAADRSVTAVLCGNDDIALGVMKAMEYAGRRVPADVSVMGFDGSPNASCYTPALSTVVMDWRGLGIRAGEEAVRLAGREPSNDSIPRAPYLQVRASTAPPLES